MKVFLIILAVIVVITAIILSLSAEATIIYDNGWHTTVGFLFFEKEVELSKLINFILFPDKIGKQAAEKQKEKNELKKQNASFESNIQEVIPEINAEPIEHKNEIEVDVNDVVSEDINDVPTKAAKSNPISKIIDEDGIVGIMLLASNLIETLNTAAITLFRGLHIYSLYVKIIVGGVDAEDIGTTYGSICGLYYPIKGMILNGMRVDQYDDYIQADFIAPANEYEFQLIASLNVALLVKIGIKAGTKFLINLIKNK